MTLSPHISQTFEPTRQAGLARLAAFLPRTAAHYARERNHDLGPDRRDNVSLLSPYVRHRLVTEEEIVHAVLSRFKLSSAEKFVQEVCWRTYWKGWLERRPTVWSDYLAAVAARRAELTANRGLAKAYEQAIAGQTGIDAFDAWAAELVETGYLHNHARMWFASIWVFTLKLPWELGADFFYRHLLDGDPASNTLSWRWVCGLQTLGKTYLARADNIAKYTGGRFTPRGLAEDAPALPSEGHPPAMALPPAASTSDMPEAVLVLTEDDLHPESLPLGGTAIKAVVALDPAGLYPDHAAAVVRFKQAALSDAPGRARAHFKCDRAIVSATGAEAAEAVLKAKLRNAATAYMPVGPQQAAFAPMRAALQSNGVEVTVVRRAWDSAFWPHASRGFFQLKEKIPKVLDSLSRTPALL